MNDRTGQLIARMAHRVDIVVLALLAYVPALGSSPGRMPADTKLYLYSDPAGLVRRAASTFEPDQFAGWVPHQQITYLWPSGPWFWMFDAVGVPDWITHRLWIGTLLFAAGCGARWLGRHVGLPAVAAAVVGITYQMSPYVLPYVSRTSLLLLPWAGLGWIVALTVRSTRLPHHGQSWAHRWRDPVLIGLIVATVGSVNATALALIAPAPALWLLCVVLADRRALRPVLAMVGRTAVVCVAVSAGWVAMLVVQARSGAPVLTYSETVEDVSRSATGSEVLRGLGYWLFYVRDRLGPTTTASFGYLVSTRVTLISYTVALVGMLGIGFTSWSHRRFVALLAASGMVLAVGVHPLDSSSPLMALMAGDGTSGLALALRSSTRAVPVLALALALGSGALVAALPDRSWTVRVPGSHRTRTFAAIALGLLVVVNLSPIWQFRLVDEAIDRDAEPPAAWTDAAADVDRRGGLHRTLQLPGAEFGAFRWGYTVDQPLVGLTDRPLVTRDLLPLGSAGAMDLLYALDDRIQEGTLDAASVAPIARLLGVDTIWLANDLQFERFRTPIPQSVDRLLGSEEALDGTGLGPVVRYGEPIVNRPDVDIIDARTLGGADPREPITPVALVDIEDPLPVVRVKTGEVLVAGSGDGLIDAATAGLVDGSELVRYTADLDDVQTAIDSARQVVITDSNRDRAHHWRGSQDVHGHTEPGGPRDDVLRPTAADQRLDVFEDQSADSQTVAIQDGPVAAIASSYGEPFAYLPEHRAVMAVDGDASTSWIVGDHGEPVGEHIRLTADSPVSSVRLVQHRERPDDRSIASVVVRAGDGAPTVVQLDERSLTGDGQVVTLPVVEARVPITISINALDDAPRGTLGNAVGVGFSEIDLGLGPTVEFIRPPVDIADDLADDLGDTTVDDGVAVSYVLSRLRTDPLDVWRSDPEPEMQRRLEVGATADYTASLTLRLDARAADDVIATLLTSAPGGAGLHEPAMAVADRRLTGSPRHRGAAAVDGDVTTSWITPFDEALGSTLSFPAGETVRSDRLHLVQPTGTFSPITEVTLTTVRGNSVLPVPAADAAGVSVIDLPASFDEGIGSSPWSLTITGIDAVTTIDRRFGDRITLPAAVAEIDVTASTDDHGPITAECLEGLLEIDELPVGVSFRTTSTALLDGDAISATICGGGVRLADGMHTVRSTGRSALGLVVDRVVLSTHVDAAQVPIETEPVTTVTDNSARRRELSVGHCPDGCWLVHGEGFNTAWSAQIDGRDLGTPVMVDGGFNGWWLEPSAADRNVIIKWTAQTPVTVGIVIAVLTTLAGIATLVVARRRSRADPAPVGSVGVAFVGMTASAERSAPSPLVAAAFAVACAALISPVWGVAAVAVGLATILVDWRAPRFTALVAPVVSISSAAAVSIAVLYIQRRDRPIPNAGWTLAVDHLNGLAVFSVLCLVLAAHRPDRHAPDRTTPTQPRQPPQP